MSLLEPHTHTHTHTAARQFGCAPVIMESPLNRTASRAFTPQLHLHHVPIRVYYVGNVDVWIDWSFHESCETYRKENSH